MRRRTIIIFIVLAGVAAGFFSCVGRPPKDGTSSTRMIGAGDDQPAASADVGIVQGRVTDEKDVPVAGVRIRAFEDTGFRPGMGLIGERLGGSTTGDDGTYRIDGLPAEARVFLLFDAPNYATVSASAIADEPDAARTSDVHLHPGFAVRGIVRGSDDRPISGAHVRVFDDTRSARDSNTLSRSETLSGADGRFELLHVTEGRIALVASKNSFIDSTAEIAVVPEETEAHNLELTLAPGGGGVSGRIVDPQGLPIAGVDVFLGHDRKRYDGTSRAASDADGRFRFDGVRPAEYDVAIQKTAWTPVLALPRVRPGDAPVEIVMRRTKTISGRVVDAADGSPVTDFTVEKWPTAHWPSTDRSTRLRFANASGRFEYAVPTEFGNMQLRVTSPGFAVALSDLIDASGGPNSSGFVIALDRGATVRGEVRTKGGSPVANAKVTLDGSVLERRQNPFFAIGDRRLGSNGQASRTNDRGHYVFEHVARGTYAVYAAHDDFSPSGEGVPFPVASHKTVEAPILSITRGGVFRGVIRDKTGKAERGTRVTLQPTDAKDLSSYFAITDADGHFEMGRVTPGAYHAFLNEKRGRRGSDLFRPSTSAEEMRMREITYDIEDGKVTTMDWPQ